MFKGQIGVLLYVNDVQRSVQFYRSLGFGFKGYWDDATHRYTMEWDGAGPPGDDHRSVPSRPSSPGRGGV